MVSAYRADALRDATGELRDLFSSHKPGELDGFPQAVSSHFSRVFQASEAFKEIPVLDTKSPPEAFPDRSLVRFRAMVQDTSTASEMYLCKNSKGHLGGWGIEDHPEEVIEDDDVQYDDLRECTVLWCIAVPGESAWSGEELDGVREDQPLHEPHSSNRPHKNPSGGTDHLGVLVEIYDTTISETFKSTDVATFVGILNTETLHFNSDLDEPVEVPTIHVLFIARPELTVVSRPYPFSPASSATERSTFEIDETRKELIAWIANEALGGDEEAAEWILLSAIARTQSRHPPILPPSITLSRFPSPPNPATSTADASNHTPTLSHVLSLLLPLAQTLPLSLNFLNSTPFVPESKDEDLHAGALQLPQGTVLLVTESGIQEGKLHDQGIANVNALQEVMTSQTLSYKFPFSQFSFPTDIGCIVLGEGRKSAFFKTDLNVPLRSPPTSATEVSNLYKPAQNIQMPSEETLARFRDVVVGARGGKVQVPESTSEYIQQDFVRDRQQDKSITSDDLIRRMMIAKLYALSLHHTELTVDTWERAKALDKRRLDRLAASIH